jgi:hypothetical protein
MYHRKPLVNSYDPRSDAGNLYYARLKTELGTFYKLGYTTMPSVAERLGREGSDDARYIDKVLLFVHHKKAYSIESRLHGHFDSKKAFGKYASTDHFPLQGNGQSELYYDDILGLDEDFSKEHAVETRRRTEQLRLKSAGFHSPGLASLYDLGAKALAGLVVVIVLPVIWLTMGVDSLLATNREKELERARVQSIKDDDEDIENGPVRQGHLR